MKKNYKIRKIVIATMLALTMAAGGLTGCGNDDLDIVDVSEESDEKEAVEEVESDNSEKDNASASDVTEDKSEESESIATETEDAEAVEAEESAQVAEEEASDIPEIYIYNKSYNYYSDDDKLLFYESYEELHLTEKSKEKYPKLADAFDKYNSSLPCEDSLREGNIEMAKTMIENGGFYGELYHTTKVSIHRADSEIVSFTSEVSDYTGGAHGYYGTGGYTFDTKTGKELSINDVVKDKSEYYEKLKESFSEYYATAIESEPNMENALEEILTDSYEPSFSVEPYGVTSYFSPYTLGSYAAGEQAIPVIFSGNEELFESRIIGEDGDWAMAGVSPCYADVDGDGKLDRIEAWENKIYDDSNNYSYTEGATIYINGEEHEVEYGGFESSYTLVKKNGKAYLYVEVSGDSDYKTILAYDLTGGTPTKIVDMMPGMITTRNPYYEYNNEENSFFEATAKLYNVDDFYLSARMNALSTYNGVRRYRIGDDGKPEPREDFYTAYDNENIVLTLKCDLTLEVVNNNTGQPTGDKKDLKSGSTYTIVRTDDESFADIQNEDGNQFRVMIENVNEWPQKINGMEIDEVFDGTLFAG